MSSRNIRPDRTWSATEFLEQPYPHFPDGPSCSQFKYIVFGFLKNRRRRAVCSKSFAPDVASALRSNVRFRQALSGRLRTKLDNAIKILIAELRWEGCDGVVVTDEMRATVAGHAAVLLLGINDYYYESVSSVLLFPDAMRRSQHGHNTRHVGEAWQSGSIVFSWPEVLSDGKKIDGGNVVIHEFAHHLDGLDGEMGGSIPFSDRDQLEKWHEVSNREYETLVDAANRGLSTLLDHYGAKNQAEFFAVASECFFELPKEMQHAHPDLFDLLCEFYHINPANWQPAIRGRERDAEP